MGGTFLGFSPLVFSVFVVYIFVVFLIVYVMFISPDSPVSLFFMETVPRAALAKMPRSMASRLECSYDYVVNQPNPIMQGVYLAIVTTAYIVMIAVGYPMIEDSPLSNLHKISGYITYAACYFTFYLACSVRAGFIKDDADVERQMNYLYDQVLYSEKKCPTTGLKKPPRSKYCRTYKVNVARFDHFCIWLNQPVGELNYRYFLLFLIVHFLMLWYGFAVTAYLLFDICNRTGLWDATFYNVATGQHVPASNLVILRYLSRQNGMYMIGLLVLSGVLGVVMTGFLAFHLYLAAINQTTNEYFKWNDLRRWHKRASKLYEQAKLDGTAGKKFDIADAGYEMVGITEEMMEEAKRKRSRKDKKKKEKKITTIRKEDDGIPIDCNESNQSVPSENDLSGNRSTVTDPGPFPRNIYDQGLRRNFIEILYPRSLYGPCDSTKKASKHKKGKSKKSN